MAAVAAALTIMPVVYGAEATEHVRPHFRGGSNDSDRDRDLFETRLSPSPAEASPASYLASTSVAKVDGSGSGDGNGGGGWGGCNGRGCDEGSASDDGEWAAVNLADASKAGRGRVAEAGLSEVLRLKRLRAVLVRPGEDKGPEQPTRMEGVDVVRWPEATSAAPGGVEDTVEDTEAMTEAERKANRRRHSTNRSRQKRRDAVRARWKAKEGGQLH